jgi:hypothetical protein
MQIKRLTGLVEAYSASQAAYSNARQQRHAMALEPALAGAVAGNCYAPPGSIAQ